MTRLCLSSARIAALSAVLLSTPLAAAQGVECLGIEISASGQSHPDTGQGQPGGGRPGGQAVPAFSAVEVEDLVVTVFLPRDLQGEHRLDVSFRLPSGHLYQTVTRPLVVETSGRPGRPGHAGARRLPDHPFPVKAAAARPATTPRGRQALAVEVRLPVAGTAIVASSLYGRWQIEAHIDGAEEACADPAELELEA